MVCSRASTAITTKGKYFQAPTMMMLAMAFGILPSQSIGMSMRPTRIMRWFRMP